jgi:hypothetical protein
MYFLGFTNNICHQLTTNSLFCLFCDFCVVYCLLNVPFPSQTGSRVGILAVQLIWNTHWKCSPKTHSIKNAQTKRTFKTQSAPWQRQLVFLLFGAKKYLFFLSRIYSHFRATKEDERQSWGLPEIGLLNLKFSGPRKLCNLNSFWNRSPFK